MKQLEAVWEWRNRQAVAKAVREAGLEWPLGFPLRSTGSGAQRHRVDRRQGRDHAVHALSEVARCLKPVQVGDAGLPSAHRARNL